MLLIAMKETALKTMRMNQKGSMVLEAMISILIFSIGILAIIGLQAASIKSAAGAKYRTDASLLANQIIGQMWIADKTNATLVGNFSSPSGARYTTWKAAVAQALPGVAGVAANQPTVVIDANNMVTVTLFWQAPNEDAPHSYTTIAVVNN